MSDAASEHPEEDEDGAGVGVGDATPMKWRRRRRRRLIAATDGQGGWMDVIKTTSSFEIAARNASELLTTFPPHENKASTPGSSSSSSSGYIFSLSPSLRLSCSLRYNSIFSPCFQIKWRVPCSRRRPAANGINKQQQQRRRGGETVADVAAAAATAAAAAAEDAAGGMPPPVKLLCIDSDSETETEIRDEHFLHFFSWRKIESRGDGLKIPKMMGQQQQQQQQQHMAPLSAESTAHAA
ncbi:GL22578 [Drosophila persimilis]|uniref:GL22578 n=1 Tax=Drosophila persimilis TaxID=7234 RepID=B4H1A6_DROPE|nr:GL22578 [Drosophila persimilis]